MTIYEKDVVFAVAQKTAQILRDHGATVIMTRSGDEAVFLNERVEMIREYDPDIYISIHNDGSDDKSLYGTHTFYYRSLSMPLADIIFNDNRKNDKRTADKKNKTTEGCDFILLLEAWIVVEFLLVKFDFCSDRFSISFQSFFFF